MMLKMRFGCHPIPQGHGLTRIQRIFADRIRTTEPKILALLERILLGEILGALCVLAVNADLRFHRQDAKDAKKTLSRRVWLRLGCTVGCHVRSSWCTITKR